jgi:hypothetical protein
MALHHATYLEDVPISYDQSLLKDQSLLNGIIGLGAHYGDAFLILISTNHVFSIHFLKYPWVYICLHTITRHKGNFNIHVSKFNIWQASHYFGDPPHAQSILLLFVNLK